MLNVERKTDDLLKMDLPPVTEKVDDFNDSAETEQTGESEQSPDISADEVNAARGTLDDKGGAFDPAIHIFPPEKTPGGKWKKKPKAKMPRSDAGAAHAQNTPNASFRREAEAVATNYALLHQLAFGEEAGIKSMSDILPMASAWEAYFAKHGVKEMPPSVAIFITHAAYSMGIVKRPGVAEKFASMLASVKKFLGFKTKEKKEAGASGA